MATNLQNCEITNHTSVESQGDQVNLDSMPSHVLITITALENNPAPTTDLEGNGYWSVSAASFSISGSEVYTAQDPSSGFGDDANSTSITNISSIHGASSIGNTNAGRVYTQSGMTSTSDGVALWDANVEKVMIVDSTIAGNIDNTVLVYIKLYDNYMMPSETTAINIDIDGDATWNPLTFSGEGTPGGQPTNVDFVHEITSLASNRGTETITAGDGFTVAETIINPGFANEQTNYTFSGTVSNDKPTQVGTIQVDANTDEYFSDTPNLDSFSQLSPLHYGDASKHIKLSLSSVGKTNDRKTSYVFNVIYQNKTKTTISDGLKASLNYNSKSVVTRTVQIDNVSFGSTTINSEESRKITVYGTPGAYFALSIVEVGSSLEDLDGDGVFERSFEQRHLDVSVLNTKNITLKPTDAEVAARTEWGADDAVLYGFNHVGGNARIPVLHKLIDSSGYYTFNQKFPKTTTKPTKLNGSMTASTTMNVDDTTGVKVGDRILMSAIPTKSIITVTVVNSATQVTTSAAITASDNVNVSFRRSKAYIIFFHKQINTKHYPGINTGVGAGALSNLGAGIPFTNLKNNEYGYTLNQYIDPTLILRVSTAGTALTINGGSAGAEDDTAYVGKANKNSKELIHAKTISRSFKVTYNLAVVNTGAHTFTVARKPVFSNIYEWETGSTPASKPNAVGQLVPASDWTNTIADDNGGTEIVITGITIGSTGATTISITANVTIKKWGNSDVIMDLDLDKIVTVA